MSLLIFEFLSYSLLHMWCYNFPLCSIQIHPIFKNLQIFCQNYSPPQKLLRLLYLLAHADCFLLRIHSTHCLLFNRENYLLTYDITMGRRYFMVIFISLAFNAVPCMEQAFSKCLLNLIFMLHSLKCIAYVSFVPCLVDYKPLENKWCFFFCIFLSTERLTRKVTRFLRYFVYTTSTVQIFGIFKS